MSQQQQEQKFDIRTVSGFEEIELIETEESLRNFLNRFGQGESEMHSELFKSLEKWLKFNAPESISFYGIEKDSNGEDFYDIYECWVDIKDGKVSRVYKELKHVFTPLRKRAAH